MAKKKKDKNIEQRCLENFQKFQDATGQKASSIADEIKLNNLGVKFSSMTIYNWVAGKSSITLPTLDLINDHMKRYGYEII